ncbi:hypothetical protein [Neorhizobium huautlense]|uniref:hypothetical protein n=1 Tax=Neorhizobium huautlense TaxID=67774 RepID=UPI001FE1AB10|nr:hypothetical protein [Neorhizobium huautlense]
MPDTILFELSMQSHLGSSNKFRKYIRRFFAAGTIFGLASGGSFVCQQVRGQHDRRRRTKLVTSGKSIRIVIDGYPFSIDIFRLEKDKTWTLEVVDHRNTSHVWDEQFESDAGARDIAVKTIEAEGALAFMRGNNVPFRQA